MKKLNARGHEVLSPVPFEPAVPSKRRRENAFERHRRLVELQRLAALDEIQTEQDLLDEQADFSADPIDEDGLLVPSPYEVPEDVPDRLTVPLKDETAQASPAPKTKESSSTSLKEEVTDV